MSRVIDLSPEVRAGPGGVHSVKQDVEISVRHKPVPPGTYWQGSTITIYAHMGAHVDALKHCQEDGWTVEKIKLDQVIGEGLVLDFSHKKPCEAIDVSDLAAYEPVVRPDDMLLVRTGWSDGHYGKEDYFAQAPYVTKEGALWLADHRPKVVGFDFPEDYCIRDRNYDPRDLFCHQNLLGNGIVILEGICNLAALPLGRRFQLFAPFVRLAGTEGSLARVFAIVDD